MQLTCFWKSKAFQLLNPKLVTKTILEMGFDITLRGKMNVLKVEK